MALYLDVISGDQLISDAFKLKVLEDVVFQVDCKMITVGTETFIDVVFEFGLQPITFDKKSYTSYLKAYVQDIKAKLSPERAPVFEKEAGNFAKEIIKNFSKFQFYTGKSKNAKGMVVLLSHRDENDFVATYWKDGLVHTGT
ncbi:Mss4-like protein [Lactarius tabidus]